MTTLIHSSTARAERIATKRRMLLRFLRKNYYTTADIAGLLMGISSRQGVHTTLLAMERDDLLRRETVEANGRRWTLWGITCHGQAMTFDPLSGEQPDPKYFEPSRVGLTVLAHSLDLQRLSVLAEKAGWIDWRLGDQQAKWQHGMSRPDALVTSPEGIVFALECERTIKTAKRYEVILADRLRARKQGEFSRCAWLCPTQDQAKRLQAIISSINSVTVAGTRFELQERHHASLLFVSYADFPNNMGV